MSSVVSRRLGKFTSKDPLLASQEIWNYVHSIPGILISASRRQLPRLVTMFSCPIRAISSLHLPAAKKSELEGV